MPLKVLKIESETETAMQLTPDQAQNEQQKRVSNLKQAYEYVDHLIASQPPTLILGIQWIPREVISNPLLAPKSDFILLHETLIKKLHQLVCHELIIPKDNHPGHYRADIKGLAPTRVSDETHGGVYIPPKSYDDIVLLIRKPLIAWINSDAVKALPALLRAPLLHYYFERIHPFRDGNGRVGRLIETWMLQAAGYQYVPKALSAFLFKTSR